VCAAASAFGGTATPACAFSRAQPRAAVPRQPLRSTTVAPLHNCHPERSEGSAFAFLSVPATQFAKVPTRIAQSAIRRDSRRPSELHDARAVCSCRLQLPFAVAVRCHPERAKRRGISLRAPIPPPASISQQRFLGGRSFSSDKKTRRAAPPSRGEFPAIPSSAFLCQPTRLSARPKLPALIAATPAAAVRDFERLDHRARLIPRLLVLALRHRISHQPCARLHVRAASLGHERAQPDARIEVP
jgi:hypothetical protein